MRNLFWILLSILGAVAAGAEEEHYFFVVAGDMRGFAGPGTNGKKYFDGVCEAIRGLGGGAFMISPGDCDPPWGVRATMDRCLGSNYLWYVAPGNHDVDLATNLAWLRQQASKGIRGLVHRGPPGAEETMYSFDYENSHFLILNEYMEKKEGDVSEKMLQWMREDLSVNGLPLTWVVGHKPIRSLPDMDMGRMRHGDGSISADTNAMSRFTALLREYGVRAYLCGHTHDASVQKVDGIWQLDSGHSRGAGDTGAPSTFLKVEVQGEQAWVKVYRADGDGIKYNIRKRVELK